MRSGWRNEIARISDDKQIPGISGCKEIGHHATIRTRNHQHVRRLTLSQTRKLPTKPRQHILVKIDHAPDQFNHSDALPEQP